MPRLHISYVVVDKQYSNISFSMGFLRIGWFRVSHDRPRVIVYNRLSCLGEVLLAPVFISKASNLIFLVLKLDGVSGSLQIFSNFTPVTMEIFG